jgi:drug/metabolite transporter (DMT)-like permease
MKFAHKILLVNSVLCSLGMLLMRYGGRQIDWSTGIVNIIKHGYCWFIGIFICWIAGLTFSLVVTKTEISIAIAFNSALIYVFVFLGGLFFLKEHFSYIKCVGSFLIIAGIFCIAQE